MCFHFVHATCKSVIAYSTTFAFPENLSYDHLCLLLLLYVGDPWFLESEIQNWPCILDLNQRNVTSVPFICFCYSVSNPTLNSVDEFFILIYFRSKEPSSGGDSLMGTAGKKDCHDTVVSQCRDEDVEHEDVFPSSNEEATSNVYVALSSMGEVKISLSCSSVLGK